MEHSKSNSGELSVLACSPIEQFGCSTWNNAACSPTRLYSLELSVPLWNTQPSKCSKMAHSQLLRTKVAHSRLHRLTSWHIVSILCVGHRPSNRSNAQSINGGSKN